MIETVKGRTYLTAPGVSELASLLPESLEACISRIFKANVFEETRKREVVYARHFYRYILERLDKYGQITDKLRNNNRDCFKYGLYQIAFLCECDHCSVIRSAQTASDLMQTDKDYKRKAEEVLIKIEHNLIILP